jgi:predicted DNA-binding transcriptional regulator YafY
VHPQIAALLRETPLSTVQSLSDLPDQSWQRLHAQVSLDRDTLWWIFGLNDNIRVHAPQVWVDEIRQKLKNLRTLYSGHEHQPLT